MSHSLSFGELLRRHRLAMGLTQEELAERAGLSARAVSDIERGLKSRPHRDTVRLLAEALGLAGSERAAFEAARGRGAAAALPANAPDRAAATVMQRGESLSPFVGRAQELALLERHLAGDGPPVLMLAGEPGIGKSRLLREAARRAESHGWRVLSGGCQRRSGQEPFAPLLEAFDGYIARRAPAELRADLRGCAWLVRLLPELATGPIEPLPAWTLAPEQERRLIDKAVGRLLANVAGPAGTLLLLDDLQWAGADALDLLATLVRGAGEPRLRVIGTYRDTEGQPSDRLGGLLADLAHAGMARQHTLAHLTAEEAGQLLDELLSSLSGDRAVVRERVVQRAGGLPFFLVSYAQGLGANAADERVPWDVAQGVRHRVAALPAEVREVLGLAAVIGRVVPHDLLVAAAAQPEAEVLAALDVAHRARLLGQDEPQTYRFTHDVIREVVEADLSPARRLALHRRTAEALERAPGEPAPELLALHYSRGNVPEKAAVYLELAGDRAWAQHANAAAQGYYRELVGCRERLGRPLDMARAHEKLGTVLRALARYDEALTALDQAAETYSAGGDVEGMARTLAVIGHVHFLTTTPIEGIARLRPILATLEARPPSQALAALYNALADLLYVTGQYDEELAAGERAVEIARTLQDERLMSFAKYQKGMALAFMGRTDEGLHVLDEAIAQAEAVGDLYTVCVALDPVGYTRMVRGEFEASARCYELAVATAERLGDPAWIANMISHRGGPAFFTGHWAQAREDFEHGVALSRKLGNSMALGYTLGWRAKLRLRSGEWTAAAEDLAEVSALLERAGDLNPLREAQSHLAELDLLQGRPAAARDRLIPLLDRAGLEEMDVTQLLPTLAWAHLELGDVPAAVELAVQAIRRAKAQSLQRALVNALRVQAMVAIRQGQWDEATSALEEGLELARTMPYPYAEARLLHVYGQMHVQTGETEPARERMEAALVIFRRLGARKDIERVEQAIANIS
ncbi:MAG TPA: AAA family ATPase [Chloroflexota bacterium]|nr:AAA family ATPase [Chloroflexota bacterium]